MNLPSTIRLIILSAIWGSSFLFMRILAPVLGAVVTANLRILIAGLALVLYFSLMRINLNWKRDFKFYALIGIINSAIPFTLYSYGAKYIPASYEVILNSTAPIFGFIFSVVILKEKINLKQMLGMFVSLFGVFFVVNPQTNALTTEFILSILACLLAALLYGFSATLIKKYGKDVSPKGIASGSQLIAGLIFIPISLSQLPEHFTHLFSTQIILALLSLALLCSSVAYLLYYRLIVDVGATKALSVTFLMPIFGILWGHLFLNESVTVMMIIGTALILIGTFLVVVKGREENS